MVGRGESGPDDPQYEARGDSVSIYQANGSTTHTAAASQSAANSQISSTSGTNKTNALWISILKSFTPLSSNQREEICVHLRLQNEIEQRHVQKSPFRNRSKCMRKRGVYDAVGVAVFAGDSACCRMLLDSAAGCCRPGRRVVQ